MKPVVERSKELQKGKWRVAHGADAHKICRALGIFLCAAMVLNMLPTGLRAVPVYAAQEGEYTDEHTDEGDGTVTEYGQMNTQESIPESVSGNDSAALTTLSAPIPVPSDLDLSVKTGDEGDLETDGYHWSMTNRILQLKDIHISGAVTLPDDTVTIETSGNCTVGEIIGNKDMYGNPNPQKTQLTFFGDGRLTILRRINLSGGDNNTLTVASGAEVVASDGISIGASGNVNSIVTVNGILTTETDAISAGKLVVGGSGELNVLGGKGVTLNGMIRDGRYDYTGVFTVERGGCFNAKCEEFGIRVYLPADSNPDQAFSLPDPEAYLPKDCAVGQARDGMIRLERRSTGEEYPGCLTIHENHEWPDDYKRDGIKHWKECTYEGCDRTTDEHMHDFGDGGGDGKCVCGSRVVVTLRDAESLIYDGGEKKPGVTVQVDIGAGDGANYRELDASGYTADYGDNTNAGRALVTVRGNGALDAPVFEQTVQFEIGKAVPTIAWSSAGQELIYTGSEAAIAPPAVTLVGGETYTGAIQYSYAVGDTGNYIPGLPRDVGTYTVRASIAEQGNYTAAESTTLLTLTNDGDSQGIHISGKPEGIITYGDTFALSAGDGVSWSASGADVDSQGNVIVTSVGPVTVTATKTEEDNNILTDQFSFNAVPRKLIPVITGRTQKVYDGTNAVSADLTVSLIGIVLGDEISAVANSCVYNSANVAEATTITATGITLSGDKAVNYELSSSFAAIAGEIEKADQPTLSPPSATDENIRDTGIALTIVENAEYRMGEDGVWQDSPVFTGLSPDTVYIFYARLKEDTNHNASLCSGEAYISTKSTVVNDTGGGDEILPAPKDEHYVIGPQSGGNEFQPATGDEHYIICPQTGETDGRLAWIIIFLSAATSAWKLCKRKKDIGSGR